MLLSQVDSPEHSHPAGLIFLFEMQAEASNHRLQPRAEALSCRRLSLAGAPPVLSRYLDTLPLGYSVFKNALCEQNSSHPYVTVSPSMFYGRVSWLNTKVAN